MTYNFFFQKGESLRFKVCVLAGSKVSLIGEITPKGLKLKIASLPVEGAANKELVKFLAKKIKIPKSRINIISGLKSKYKVIEVDAYTTELFLEFLKKEGLDL